MENRIAGKKLLSGAIALLLSVALLLGLNALDRSLPAASEPETAEAGYVPGRDMILISIDGGQEAMELLQGGKINCIVECTPKLGSILMETALKLKAGETVVYAFEQPEAVAQVRLVFDSDLNRETEPEEIARLNRNMIHNRPLGWPQAIVPKTLPEAYRILGVKEDGTKEILAETTRVHQRLMVHGVAGRYQAIVLEILKTRGETCGLFAMDLK